jgi:SAM-dependent methyltransferase
MSGTRQSHWQSVYETKAEDAVSWFQPTAEPSLELISLTGARSDSAIIDIGGGASRLIDDLLAAGFQNLSVLDLSEAALAAAHARIGPKGDLVHWIVDDATSWTPPQTYDVWHDRAAFHFLTSPGDQSAYLTRLRQSLKQGGHAIFGTFALDGPEKCSGLPVQRHSASTLAKLLGPDFKLIHERLHDHATPFGTVQKFQFAVFVRG